MLGGGAAAGEGVLGKGRMRAQERGTLPTGAFFRHPLAEQPQLSSGSGTDEAWEDLQGSTKGKVRKCSLWSDVARGIITLTSVVHACNKTHSALRPPALDASYCYPLYQMSQVRSRCEGDIKGQREAGVQSC